MGVSKTSDHIQIKIKIQWGTSNVLQNPSQDLEDIDILCSTEDYTYLTELKPLKTKPELYQTRTKSKPKPDKSNSSKLNWAKLFWANQKSELLWADLSRAELLFPFDLWMEM